MNSHNYDHDTDPDHTRNPALLAPSTAAAVRAIGERLGHESANETVEALLEYLATTAAAGDPEALAADLRAASADAGGDADPTGTDNGGDGGAAGSSATAPVGRGEIEQMAESTLTLRDLKHMEREGLSASEHLRRTYGINPARFDDEHELHARVREARDDLTEQTGRTRTPGGSRR